MVKKVKPVKPKAKPKVKKETKLKQKQKQSVNVKVVIDQSKKGRISSGGGMVARQPSNIINFPSNSGTSEIRYNPEVRYLPNPSGTTENTPASASASAPVSAPIPIPASAPLGMAEPREVTENVLVRTQAPTRPDIYRSPFRDDSTISLPSRATGISNLSDSFPDASTPNVLGTVSSVGSILLSEAYPEYSDIFELASQFSQSNIAKKGVKRISRLAGDAWDNLSLFTQRTLPQSVVTNSSSDNPNYPMRSDFLSISTRSTLPVPIRLAPDFSAENNFMDDTFLSVSSDSTPTVFPDSDFTAETLSIQITPPKLKPTNRAEKIPKLSDNEIPFEAGGVAGRVYPIESKIRKQREQSEYDKWRESIKGKGYSNAQKKEMWQSVKDEWSMDGKTVNKKTKTKEV